MNKILEQIGKIGIVPVIAIDDVEKAAPLARALIAGGIPIAEVTFRTAEGEAALRCMARETPDILLGAGTIRSVEQVDRAVDAGAQFIVTPGFNPQVVSHCAGQGIPIIPGCSTPSDIEQALERGLDVVKFFPAEQSGGLEYLKAIAAPYPTVRFMPTGGINAGNIAQYIIFDRILACGGSWMVSPRLLGAGNFDEIARLCREALANMLGFSVRHLGINAESQEAASRAAALFSVFFGFPCREGAKSVFAGDAIEVMKSPGFGVNGHIAIGTNSVFRAVAWLERQGLEFNWNSAHYENGVLTVIYLKQEIAGFAVHLVQNKEERHG